MVDGNRGANAFAQLSMLMNPMVGGYGYGAPMMTGGYGAPMGAPMTGGYGAPMAGGYVPGTVGGYSAPMTGGYGAPMAGGTPAPAAGGAVSGPAPQRFNPVGAPAAPATDRPIGVVEPPAATGDVAKGFKA